MKCGLYFPRFYHRYKFLIVFPYLEISNSFCGVGYDNIFCLSVRSSCVHGDLRLQDGSSATEGRVEICMDGIWGTICGAFLGINAATVICRQLGFIHQGMKYKSSSQFFDIFVNHSELYHNK